MPTVFARLNLKNQAEIVVLNPPASFEPELSTLSGVNIQRELAAALKIEFILSFVTRQAEIDSLAHIVGEKAPGDALVWFAYPKGSSKKYRCEFNRDSGWNELGVAGFEAVRQVAIDEDWSALRFRRVEYIKSMQRDAKRAMSAGGKERLYKADN